MKKTVCLFLILVLAIALAASSSAEMLAGGWETAEYQVLNLPDEEARAAFDKATGQLDGAAYTPVALIGKQIVAGTNYCILCQITPVVPDAKPVWALVYIYADLEGNAEITNVYEIYYDRHSQPEEAAAEE